MTRATARSCWAPLAVAALASPARGPVDRPQAAAVRPRSRGSISPSQGALDRSRLVRRSLDAIAAPDGIAADASSQRESTRARASGAECISASADAQRLTVEMSGSWTRADAREPDHAATSRLPTT